MGINLLGLIACTEILKCVLNSLAQVIITLEIAFIQTWLSLNMCVREKEWELKGGIGREKNFKHSAACFGHANKHSWLSFCKFLGSADQHVICIID